MPVFTKVEMVIAVLFTLKRRLVNPIALRQSQCKQIVFRLFKVDRLIRSFLF